MLSQESRQNLDNLIIEYPELISRVSVTSNRINSSWVHTDVSIHGVLSFSETLSALKSIPGIELEAHYSFDFKSEKKEFTNHELLLEGIEVSVITPKEKSPVATEDTQETIQSDSNIVWDAESIMAREG